MDNKINVIGAKTETLGVGLAYLTVTEDNKEYWKFTKDSQTVLEKMADPTAEFIVADNLRDAVAQLEVQNIAPEGFTKIFAISKRDSLDFDFSSLSNPNEEGIIIGVLTDNTVLYTGKTDIVGNDIKVDLNSTEFTTTEILDKAQQFDKVYLDPGIVQKFLAQEKQTGYPYHGDFVMPYQKNFILKSFKTGKKGHRWGSHIFSFIEHNEKRAKSLSTRWEKKTKKQIEKKWGASSETWSPLGDIPTIIMDILIEKKPILGGNISFNESPVTVGPSSLSESDREFNSIWYYQRKATIALDIATYFGCGISIRKNKEIRKILKTFFDSMNQHQFKQVPSYLFWPFFNMIEKVFRWKKMPTIYRRYQEEQKALNEAKKQEETLQNVKDSEPSKESTC